MADNTVKKSMKTIQNLTQEEHALAENLVTVMKTLKTVTVMMCEASSPTASMILPLKMNILNSMAQSDDDSPAVRDVKKTSGRTWSRDTLILPFRITYTSAQL
ncbi:unnamed protein product [Oreochromis niloticus]|nr:unnamed protein product [Mustela putorius furo]